VVSDNGLKQTVTVRKWRDCGTRARRRAGDRGQTWCAGSSARVQPEPGQPSAAMADFEATIQGLSAFCAGYPEKSATDAAVMKQYIESHQRVRHHDLRQQHHVHPDQAGAVAGRRDDAGRRSARCRSRRKTPCPGTPGVYNHMFSDGPYQQVSYTPKKEIKFTRNPVMAGGGPPSSDPLRKAYVNAINVDETGKPDHDLPGRCLPARRRWG